MKKFVINTHKVELYLGTCKGEKESKKQRVELILTTTFNNFKVKILSMQVEQNQFVNAVLALVDSDTQVPIVATFTNVVITSADTNILTVDSDVNADGTLDIVGITEGVTSVNIKATATYTDKKTKKVVVKDVQTDVVGEVTAAPPQNTELVVTFTPQQPVP